MDFLLSKFSLLLYTFAYTGMMVDSIYIMLKSETKKGR
jgi:hypothetical protein